jgi:NADH-quinone oxidoreductase subunit G
MPQVHIDGKTYAYEGQPMLLQFALDNGIEIPYFCYHPAMTIPTNCRMCLVEVGMPMRNRETGQLEHDETGELKVAWGRKPNTSCNTPIAPDMVVKTNRTSEKVKEMQKGVLEYMLVNHPLDCPICDQAGECPLQIWTYKYGPEGSRFENLKVHKPKRMDLGPNVILDAERCINCTRCVRFTEEISKTNQLSIMGRGENNYPQTAPGEIFDDAYSMNTIDICPVGALTSRDFRFQARVWEMAFTPGICTGCSRGCNVDVWVRDNKVLRLTPRENKAVNQYWMCDAGRLDIAKLNEGRISGVYTTGLTPVIDFEEGIKKAAQLMKEFKGKIFFIGSPFASLESNYALRHLANKLGNKEVHYVPNVMEGWGDDILRQDDRTPNSKGCEMLGFTAISLEEIAAKFEQSDFQYVYMLEDERLIEAVGENLSKVTAIVHATRQSSGLKHAAVVLPAATSIEGESTFVNATGVAQVSRLAKEIRQMTPEMWMRLPKSRLDKAAVANDSWRTAENIYDVLPSWLLIAKLAKAMGHDLIYKEHSEIFQRLKAEFESMRDMKVSYKPIKESFKISQFDFAVK